MTDAELKALIIGTGFTKETCRWSQRAATTFLALTNSFSRVHDICPGINSVMAYRTAARYVGIRSTMRMGFCKAYKQTDKCLIDTVWDSVLEKRIHKQITQAFQDTALKEIKQRK